MIVINPELLMDEACAQLWKKPKFTSRILQFVFDEGHCVSEWGKFRTEYLHLGNLRHLIPETIPFYVASATLPLPILLDVAKILRLRPGKTEHIIRSNDRPNISLVVRGIQYNVGSYMDLAFLIPDNFQDGDTPPEKFLIFFDSTRECEDAVKYLQSRLPRHLHGKVQWFHATMSNKFREEEYETLRTGERWGLGVTSAFGMVGKTLYSSVNNTDI